MRKAFKWIFAIFVVASVFCGLGCKDKVEVELKPTKQYGTVKGKAFYSNENVDNHSGIQITLVSTDGLRSVAYCESRGIATNARSVSDIKTTAKDGSYSFENIPVGTYTILASSRNSVEEAIETNVNVRANEVVTANDLNLVATGNVKGTITIDGKTDGTLGLDVFIAGTSYVAKVGPTGNYEISKIPASKGYMLCVQKGEYTTIINEDLEVKAKETIEVGCKNLLSEDWAIENEVQTNPTFKWLGEFATEPEDPDLYDAYYNTTDGCSYIWNGSDWDLLAKSGEDGVDGEDGENGTDGKDGVDGQSIVWKGALEAAPENPELYWAYYNTTDGCSYIWNGNDWDLLAKSGEDGEDGKDGTNGKDGEDGKDGVNGIDGKDGVDGQSIVWKGALEAAPENPELYWAYYNTTDGCSYIWNGSDWDLLAKSGEDGADGEDGKDGTNGKDGVDGQSIVWKGALEAAPENPELNWAYYNINTGCSYIWNGSDWDLLTQHANHTFNEWTVVTAPTCETEGKEERACAVCLYKEEKSIQATGHSYGAYVLNNDATILEDGTKTRICSVCGKEDSAIVEGTKTLNGIAGTPTGLLQGQTYSSGITIDGTVYSKTSEVVVVPEGTEAYVYMTNNSSWSTYLINDIETSYTNKGVFIKGRKVKLSPFVMSQYEVTQELYQAVTGSNPSDLSDGPADGESQKYRPVDSVSWYDALVFCNKLSMKLGLTPCYKINESTNPDDWGTIPKSENETWDSAECNLEANGYRLPTETEWEYAARGGDPTKTEWKYAYSGSQTENGAISPGSKSTDAGLVKYGWYFHNCVWYVYSAMGTERIYLTHEVGKLLPNSLGLYDMSGNVHEFCWDWYDSNPIKNDELYTNKNAIVEKPKGFDSGESRVIRGGSYFDTQAYYCWNSSRSRLSPFSKSNEGGFRLVRSSSN